MKYLKSYNESLRDKMIPKSKEEIEKAMKKLPRNDRFNKYLEWEEWDKIKKMVNGFRGLSQNQLDKILQKAASVGEFDMVKLSIKKGADVNYFNGTAIRGASLGGYFVIVKYLLSKGSKDGESALEKAGEYGHLEIVKYLIEKGYRDFGLVMRKASGNGHIDVVKYLLSKGSNDNYSINYAEKYGHTEIVDLLKAHGFKKIINESLRKILKNKE